jgi:membrane fusion protein, heavy metal efflux system
VTITSPIGGEVEKRPVNTGEIVAAGQTLATILNTETVWVESDVFDKDLSRVRIGQRVTIAADAVPGRTFAGTVNYIGAEVNPETRAVRVRTVVANRGEVLKPNMFVRALIGTAGSENAVTVPADAVQEDGAASVVFVEEVEEEEGMYRRRVVRVGPTLGNQIVIQSGLLPGEKVVTAGAYQLLVKAR